MRWEKLSAQSHYKTAVAVNAELERGNVNEAASGIKELIDALARSERRALKSQLIRLMLHVLKWKAQPDKRSRSWAASIYSARDEIADIQEETPSLTNDVIKEMWEKCCRSAKRDAEAEMNQAIAWRKLTWKEVFDADYEVE